MAIQIYGNWGAPLAAGIQTAGNAFAQMMQRNKEVEAYNQRQAAIPGAIGSLSQNFTQAMNSGTPPQNYGAFLSSNPQNAAAFATLSQSGINPLQVTGNPEEIIRRRDEKQRQDEGRTMTLKALDDMGTLYQSGNTNSDEYLKPTMALISGTTRMGITPPIGSLISIFKEKGEQQKLAKMGMELTPAMIRWRGGDTSAVGDMVTTLFKYEPLDATRLMFEFLQKDMGKRLTPEQQAVYAQYADNLSKVPTGSKFAAADAWLAIPPERRALIPKPPEEVDLQVKAKEQALKPKTDTVDTLASAMYGGKAFADLTAQEKELVLTRVKSDKIEVSAAQGREAAQAAVERKQLEPVGEKAANWLNEQGQQGPADKGIEWMVSHGFHPVGTKLNVAQSRQAVSTLLDQLTSLVPKLENKGFLSTRYNLLAVEWAKGHRALLPADPDLENFLMHASTMVSLSRQLGDIGGRSQMAYESLVNLIKKPTSAEALRQSLGNLKDALAATGTSGTGTKGWTITPVAPAAPAAPPQSGPPVPATEVPPPVPPPAAPQGQPPAAIQGVDALSPQTAAQYPGRTVRDPLIGKKYKSNGKAWVPVP